MNIVFKSNRNPFCHKFFGQFGFCFIISKNVFPGSMEIAGKIAHADAADACEIEGLIFI